VTVGVRGKLFAISLLLIATAVLASGVFAETRLRELYEHRLEGEVLRQAETMRVVLADAPADMESLDALADRLGHGAEARVTIIGLDGTVLGDSDLDLAGVRTVENHGGRPEVLQALARGIGTARRFSTTVKHDLLYAAATFPDQGPPRGIVRVAIPLEEIDHAAHRLRSLLLVAALVGLLLAVAMSGVASELMSRQLRALVRQARGLVSSPTDPVAGRRDELGRLAGSLSWLGDELGRSVGELATERDRLQTVLAQMSDAVLALDADDKLVLLNDAAGSLLGIGDEARGRPLLEAARIPDLEALVRRARDGEPTSGECRLPGPPERILMAHAAPLHTMSGCVVVLHDVTDVRRLERVRRDFVANVSHELRTPVSVIRANAEALLAGALQDRERGPVFVDAVHRNAERLARLINDLLDLSRIEAGHYQTKPRPIAVAEALTTALDGQRARADERGVAVDIDASDDLYVRADATALAQILQNLLDNAIKYAQKRIVLRAHAHEGDVRVEVEDDGPGIEPHHRSRVFERFYRVDPGRSRELGGTGLGLSIVKHLAEAMDGTVGVEPAPERGSRFWVVLPREDAPKSRRAGDARVAAQ
jgi:two-component system, OmpR family, phosphate regulon sensor histidine kinase PhoR